MAKATKTKDDIQDAWEARQEIQRAGEPEFAGLPDNGEESAVEPKKTGKRKKKGPRIAYYMIVGQDKTTKDQVIIATANTKGQTVKVWQSVHQMAVRQYKNFCVLRVKPIEELNTPLFAHFKD